MLGYNSIYGPINLYIEETIGSDFLDKNL